MKRKLHNLSLISLPLFYLQIAFLWVGKRYMYEINATCVCCFNIFMSPLRSLVGWPGTYSIRYMFNKIMKGSKVCNWAQLGDLFLIQFFSLHWVISCVTITCCLIRKQAKAQSTPSGSYIGDSTYFQPPVELRHHTNGLAHNGGLLPQPALYEFPYKAN